MENIDIKSLEKVLDIINKYPSVRVGHFSDSSIVVAKAIESFCKKYDIEYLLNATSKEYFESVKDKIESAIYFNTNRQNFMMHGKFYDYLFVQMKMDNKETLLSKFHKIVKNAGLILIFVKSDNLSEIYELERLLEETLFVATSKIEIDSNYTLIVSKKMHGWGV